MTYRGVIMETDLDTLAWAIISGFHHYATSISSDDTRMTIDASRLSALNWVLRGRLERSHSGPESEELACTSLSYEGERRGLDKNQVIDLVQEMINNTTLDIRAQIEGLSIRDFVDLLGRLHSIGSYRLPVSQKKPSRQRSLGAYYTPFIVADYIVSLTLEPRLKTFISKIKKKGLPAIQDILSLKILDPACGTGAFLISTSLALQDAVEQGIKVATTTGSSVPDLNNLFENVGPSLYGVDLDSGAIEVANISLKLINAPKSSSLSRIHLKAALRNGNSLISRYGLDGLSENQKYFTNLKNRYPFEWKEEFPEVFNRDNGGFDFIIMNPPYERLKPNLAEFMRERLLQGDKEIHTDLYVAYKDEIKRLLHFFRKSNEYPLSTSYTVNTYQLFIERALQLIKEGGKIGCIVPSNILCDISAQALRRNLLLHNSLESIDEFPETSRIFPNVTQSVSILTFTRGGTTESIDIGFNQPICRVSTKRDSFKISLDDISRSMGASLVIPRIDASGFKLLRKMHTHPSLLSLESVLIRRGELDLTIDKKFMTSNNTGIRLVRGSNISRFTQLESTHESQFVNLDEFLNRLNSSERANHIGMNRIACQQVSNMGQRWRLKFASISPPTILANSCNYLLVTPPDAKTLDFVLGLLNSELLNWRFQVSNSNNHVSIRELQNLPIILPWREQRGLRNLMLKEVAKQKSDPTRPSPNLEAVVFSLYGFNNKEVELILRYRRAPDEECRRILRAFSELS
ncbi:MAG: N-6 DNA methylase [Candidatus Thorarchaeota archaeon]|nr:N-6 DNA methylase [Candidatus Thorarchaeota archaeon]